jgi:CBS domain-containing protein
MPVLTGPGGNRLEPRPAGGIASRVLDFAATDRRTFVRSGLEVMSHDLITAGGATLREAAELMVRHRIGASWW